MIRRKEEMKVTSKNMRGGNGEIQMTHHLAPEELSHGRLFSTVTVEKGNSIGYHEHHNETEYYLILSGEGIVEEAEGDSTVKAGDLVITGNGQGHAIRNEKDDPLVFIALIVLDD